MNSAEIFFLETVQDSYLCQHVEHATHRRGNDAPSLIDLIFTDEEMQVSGVSHHSPLGKSDHSVITFNYHCYLDYAKPTDRYNYTMKRLYDEEKASILLKQFSSVFNKEHEGEIPRIPRRTERNVGELRVTEVMVKKELLSLNINKSSGPDKINPRIMIELVEYIAGPIAFLFNMTMNHGVLPRD